MFWHGWLWRACHACCFFVRVKLSCRSVGGASVHWSELMPLGKWGEGPGGPRTRLGLMAGSRLTDFNLKSHNNSVQYNLRAHGDLQAGLVPTTSTFRSNLTCAFRVTTISAKQNLSFSQQHDVMPLPLAPGTRRQSCEYRPKSPVYVGWPHRHRPARMT